MNHPFINLCGHAINLVDAEGYPVLDLGKNEIPARISCDYQLVREIAGVPIFKPVYGAPVNLPDPQPDTIFIVSGLLRAAFPNRTDLMSPGNTLRDANGQPCGSVGLVDNS